VGSGYVVSPAAAKGLRNDQIVVLAHSARTYEIHASRLNRIIVAVGAMRNQIHVAKLQLVAAAFTNGLLGFDWLVACYPDGHISISL